MGRRKNTIEYIFSTLDKTSNPNGCWEWTKAKDYDGYGITTYNGKIVGAHRLSYLSFNGPIAQGLFVCHSCDNPSCCNPSHLWLGTNQENQIDNRDKGRKCGRPKIGQSIMTPDGQFSSRKEAAEFYNIGFSSLHGRMKRHPTLYYYI